MFARLKWGSSISVLALLLLLLVACSGKSVTNEKVKESDDPTSGTENERKEENGEAKYGGIFTILPTTGPPTLDPFRASSAFSNSHFGLMYNKLVTYATGDGVEFTDYNVIPDLAEDWDISDDGTVYTFYLRDTNWHDIAPVNGRAVVAEDVIVTMEQIMNLPGHQASLLSEVKSVEAKDDKTIVFTLKQPFAPFLNFMANHFMWILPKEAIDGEIDLAKMGIGTGPFILEEYNENVQATFVRNPDYYEEGKPYLDGVNFKYIPDLGTQLAALRAGKAERINALSPEDNENLVKTNPDILIEPTIYETQTQVFMNVDIEPFNDLRVRQAISLAIDRKNMVKQIYGEGEVSGPVNPSMGDWALPLEEREALQPYDPEKAKKLLAEAGYPNGFNTTVITTDGYGENFTRQGQWIVEDLRTIGINAEIKIFEYATFFSEKWPKKEYEMGIGLQSHLQEADRWLTEQYHTNGSRNFFGTDDSKLNAMLEEQRIIFDEDDRKEKVYDIQRYILKNVINPIPVMSQYNAYARQPYVKNWHPHASYGYIYLKDVWLDK